MPRLLYRYILSDLLRIVGLTAAVLVTVIAFGVTIKPLSNDALLDAGQTAKYLMLAIVPMLQFALPFAAGFGATQVLHRMTTDNEIQAMAVSGISYRRILLPVIGMGIALSLIMVVLTQAVIPRFWSLISQTVSRDATKLFQASIGRGEPFQAPGSNTQIHAEYMMLQESPEGEGGPETRMVLLKVAAATLDDQGRVETDVTANQAVADVYRRNGRTVIKLVMRDAVAFRPDSGQLGGSAEVHRTIVYADPLRDNPSAMTRNELLALRKNPDTFAQVIEAREDLIESIRQIETRNAIESQLKSAGRVELLGEAMGDAGEHRGYVIAANQIKDHQFINRDGSRVEVFQFEGAAAVRRFVADVVQIDAVPQAESSAEPAFELNLVNVDVSDLRPGGAVGGSNQRAQLSIPMVRPAKAIEEDLTSLTSEDLIARGLTVRNTPDRIQKSIAELREEINSLQRGITSRLLFRYVLSCTAFLLLMLGATLALWLRGSLPLTIYAWAFLPSILDLILISTGEQLLRDGRPIGHIIMWSGNALMLAGILFAYWRVSKH